MCKVILSVLVVLISTPLFAQKTTVKWGEEFKMKKGGTDFEVVYADKSGVYLEEGHLALKSYFVIGATLRSSAKLVKLDQNFSELFSASYDKELKGKNFVQFLALKGKLYMFASEERKKEDRFIIHAVEVSTTTGDIKETWREVATLPREKKSDELQFKLTLNADSSSVIMVSSVEGREKSLFRIQKFDAMLKSRSGAVEIANEFDTKTYQLEDVIYTNRDRIILVARMYQYREGKKKKEKYLDFDSYNIRLYDEKGGQVTELNTEVNGKWLTGTKVVQQQNNDLILAAFYSDSKKDKTLDGMMVQRLNSLTGEVVSVTDKKLDHSMVSGDPDDDDDPEDAEESKSERKERQRLEKMKDEGEAFSSYMKFRNIFYTPDGGLLIVAEKYHSFTYTTYSYTPGRNGFGGSSSSQTYTVYECGDLLLCKLDAKSEINWLKLLPKAQREQIYGGSSGYAYSYFAASDRPFYAGFAGVQVKDRILLFFNDSKSNGTVTQAGQKVRKVTQFGKSSCFEVNINPISGAITRKVIFSNADQPTAMPRLGSIVNNEVYLIGKDDRTFGKSKVAIAKLTVK